VDSPGGEHSEILGAYALDALDPAEAEEVRRHVADCSDCKHQLDRFAQVEGLLAQVPLDALLESLPDIADLLP
jgi:anti-sigma factor RsiW